MRSDARSADVDRVVLGRELQPFAGLCGSPAASHFWSHWMASLTAEAPSFVWRGRALSGGWYVLPLYCDARVASLVATSPGANRAADNASRTSASSVSQGLSAGAVVDCWHHDLCCHCGPSAHVVRLP